MFNHILSCIFFDDEPSNFFEFLLCFFFPLWCIPVGIFCSILRILRNFYA